MKTGTDSLFHRDFTMRKTIRQVFKKDAECVLGRLNIERIIYVANYLYFSKYEI